MTRTADIHLLQSGAVHLFWKSAVLDKWRAQLDELGYAIHIVDCTEDSTMRAQFSEALRWEEQFGYGPWTGNLDALNDGLRGFPPEGVEKAALILMRFDLHADRKGRAAIALLDIIERQSRHRMLSGKRLLALVQTNDAGFRTPDLGGYPATWNPDEGSNASRGL